MINSDISSEQREIMNNFVTTSKSFICLPLYQEFTRILIWPAEEDEGSSYEVWSLSAEIPPDLKSSEVLKFGVPVPFFRNHHYVAVAAGQFFPQWVYYHSQPDVSAFRSSVKVFSFKIGEPQPQLTFGTLDEIEEEKRLEWGLTSFPLLVTEHPYQVKLLRYPPVCVSTNLTGGGKIRVPPLAKTDDEEFQKLITLTRSLGVWRGTQHEICPLVEGNVAANLCHFCLTRSQMVRLAKRTVKPVELSRVLTEGRDVKTLCSDLIRSVSKAFPPISEHFLTSLSCTDCSEKLFGGDGGNCLIDLKTNNQNEDLSVLVNKQETNLQNYHRKSCKTDRLQSRQDFTVLFLSCDTGMKLRLTKTFNFFGKNVRCKAAVSATCYYFSSNGMWYQVSNKTIKEFPEDNVSDVLLVSLEADSANLCIDEETIIYKNDEYQRISNIRDRHKDKTDRHKDQTDRHKDTPQRKEDRHQDTPQRREDRHIDQTDRHKDTSQRKEDRHKDKTFRGGPKTLQKVKKDINDDTGMEVICCSCLELKSRRSCVSLNNLPHELINKYCHQHEISRSIDGKFYVCITCRTSIKSDREPTRAMKELIGLLEFPEGKN